MLEHGEQTCTGSTRADHLCCTEKWLAREPATLSLEVGLLQIGKDAAVHLDHTDEVLDLDLKRNQPI
jgi:hypothetical protein